MKRFGEMLCGMVALVFVSALAIGAETAGEWPQWRGPNRDGISKETGLLKEWPAGGPKLVWKATGLGDGYSGLSAVGGKLYTMGDLAGSSQVICLNVADGKPVWTAKVGKTGGGGGFPGPRCTPATDGQGVWAMDQFGDLVCVAAATGKEVWRKSMTADYKGGVGGWGYSESPLLDGNIVAVTPGGRGGAVVALNKTTGALVWRCTQFTDGADYSSIAIAEIGGVRQYMQLTQQSVVGIEPKSGQMLWRAPRQGRTAVVTTPVCADGVVFVTSGYGVGHSAFKVTGSGTQFKADLLYSGKEMANHHGGVIVVGEHLYGHSDAGGWMCIEVKSGNVVWKNNGVGKGSCAYADGHLYCRSEGGPGVVALVEASPAGYKETGRFQQPDRSKKNSWPHPVIADGKLYLRDQDVLLCYDLEGK
ncbi:MAG TPA: PQQ-binding-like beta-propeller repeat protein [Planctomycetota bacterium]|jgi:outer membrane protein assembly factor BamB